MSERRLLGRISEAVADLDLGISPHVWLRAPLRGINLALRTVGRPQIKSLEPGELRKAAMYLEAEG